MSYRLTVLPFVPWVRGRVTRDVKAEDVGRERGQKRTLPLPVKHSTTILVNGEDQLCSLFHVKKIANSKKFYEQRFFSFLSLTIFKILPITSQLLSTILFLHPFKFFLSQKKKKDEKETFPLVKKERIVKIKKKKEKYERERVVTRGPRQRTGCNSQIYYFSPLVSGAYFMPKRQTGAQAERGEDERRGNEYLSCFVAFLRPRDILVDR